MQKVNNALLHGFPTPVTMTIRHGDLAWAAWCGDETPQRSSTSAAGRHVGDHSSAALPRFMASRRADWQCPCIVIDSFAHTKPSKWRLEAEGTGQKAFSVLSERFQDVVLSFMSQ